jgi:hypothetical protein
MLQHTVLLKSSTNSATALSISLSLSSLQIPVVFATEPGYVLAAEKSHRIMTDSLIVDRVHRISLAHRNMVLRTRYQLRP